MVTSLSEMATSVSGGGYVTYRLNVHLGTTQRNVYAIYGDAEHGPVSEALE
jgi:hypothetical protein